MALAAGWVVAVLIAAMWSWRNRRLFTDPAPTPTSAPERTDPAQEAPVANAAAAPPTVPTAPPASPALDDAPPVVADDPQPSDAPANDPHAALAQAERVARGTAGFLSGYYALVGPTLEPLWWPPRSTGDYTVRADPDDPRAYLYYGHSLRTIARDDVTATYSYEARGRHIGGALLEPEAPARTGTSTPAGTAGKTAS